MGVLANLVPYAQPALEGDGCEASGSDGASWKWIFSDITDSTGALVDFTTVTGTCTVLTAAGGTTVVTVTFTGAVGGFTLSVDESLTVGLSSGATQAARRCVWRLSMTDGTDIVQGWGPLNSYFLIYPGA